METILCKLLVGLNLEIEIKSFRNKKKSLGMTGIQTVDLKHRPLRLGVPNQNDDDSDFKPADFDCPFRYDLDFNDEIVSTIAILIKLQSNFD